MSETYKRKSVYALGADEKTALRDAFQALYDQRIADEQDLVKKYPKKYQELAAILNAFGHYQRNDLLFLPWARAYFWWFEQALQMVSPGISLPYWDYTSEIAIDQGLPDLFTDEEYVNGEGKTAPNPLLRASYHFPLLSYREVKADTSLLQKAADQVVPAMAETDFVNFSMAIYPVDILSHSYVGGSLANTHSTSYDPLFWFTHCQLDHFWWQWQNANNNYLAPASVLETKLSPFTIDQGSGLKVIRGLDVMHTNYLGYTYDN